MLPFPSSAVRPGAALSPHFPPWRIFDTPSRTVFSPGVPAVPRRFGATLARELAQGASKASGESPARCFGDSGSCRVCGCTDAVQGSRIEPVHVAFSGPAAIAERPAWLIIRHVSLSLAGTGRTIPVVGPQAIQDTISDDGHGRTELVLSLT